MVSRLCLILSCVSIKSYRAENAGLRNNFFLKNLAFSMNGRRIRPMIIKKYLRLVSQNIPVIAIALSFALLGDELMKAFGALALINLTFSE